MYCAYMVVSSKYMTTAFRIIKILLVIFLTSCIGAGTLGGFDLRSFSTSKKNIVRAIDSLYLNYPEYVIPSKWTKFDIWKSRGYDFLDSRIFYFSVQPEEMYYVTFYGDANDSIQINHTYTALSIRAYCNGNYKWLKEEDCTSKQKERIQKRFDEEIIPKLQKYIDVITADK